MQAGLEGPAAERPDVARLLGDLGQLGGVDAAQGRRGPAHQRFGADRLAGPEVDTRLVGEDDLAPVEGAAQLVLEGESANRPFLHRLREEAVAAARGLRGVERRIGALAQVVARSPVVRVDRDADTRRRIEALPHDLHRLADRGQHALRDQLRVGGAVDAREHDRELVAPEPGDADVRGGPILLIDADHVLGAHRIGEARRDDPQQLVAGVVAQAVVDQLEAVEIDVDEAELGALALRPAERAREAIVEIAAIAEAGQLVDARAGLGLGQPLHVVGGVLADPENP